MLQYIIPVAPAHLVNLFIIEIVLILLNMVLFAWMIAVCIKVQIHVNLKAMGISALAQYYLSLSARLAIVVIESGFFPSTPLPKADGLVVFLSVLRTYHNALVLSMPLWLFIERFLAMYYINDYERIQRKWISVWLIGISTTYSIFGSVSFNLDWSPWKLQSCFAVFIGFVGCVLFHFLKRHTEKMYDELNNRHRTAQIHYTLSLRFQLEENLKSTKLIFHAIIGLAAINLIGFVFFFFAHFEGSVDWLGLPTIQLLDVIFNLYVTVNGPIIALALVMRNDHVVDLLKAMIRGEEKMPKKIPDEGQIYFLQLQAQWGQPGTNREHPAGRSERKISAL